jgi:hypothetical protein
MSQRLVQISTRHTYFSSRQGSRAKRSGIDVSPRATATAIDAMGKGPTRSDDVRAQVPAYRQGTKGVGSGASDDPLMQLLKARELMASQDRLDLKWAVHQGFASAGGALPSLGQFATDCSTSGTWREVLKDPEAAAAMRHLRRRVTQLNDPMKAVEPSRFAYAVINNWPERVNPQGIKNRETLTQPRNPFNWSAQLTPSAVANCREEAARRHPPKPVEQTSFWTERWGAVCSEIGFDSGFQYERKYNPRGGGWPRDTQQVFHKRHVAEVAKSAVRGE